MAELGVEIEGIKAGGEGPVAEEEAGLAVVRNDAGLGGEIDDAAKEKHAVLAGFADGTVGHGDALGPMGGEEADGAGFIDVETIEDDILRAGDEEGGGESTGGAFVEDGEVADGNVAHGGVGLPADDDAEGDVFEDQRGVIVTANESYAGGDVERFFEFDAWVGEEDIAALVGGIE